MATVVHVGSGSWTRKVTLVFGLLGLLAASPARGASVQYLDEASFLGAAGVVAMESFEGLVATNGVDVASLSLLDFELTAPFASNLSVFDIPSDGMQATDGVQYIRSELQAVWTFTVPIFSFGLTMTDHSSTDPSPIDGSLGITFNLGNGDSFNPPLVPAENAIHFWGVVSDVAFTQIEMIMPDNDFIGLDEILYANTQGQVPGPSGAALLLLAGAGLALHRRR